ncbi:MAG TPA: phosphatase domain-containing protein [Candidatus Binatia bacterium]|nr:phosphatase domain-containing protein [Candidatus Binatia bacterium]
MSRAEPEAPAPAGGEPAVTFRWDLDKTYLRTEFETFRQLVRIPFESAADKVHLPGVPQLIRALRRSALARGERPYVFFLSASPPQIGTAIRQKLDLDGIEYDGITFKDQLRNLMRGRFKSLTEQIGYKLAELLEARVRGPAAPREVLFGDDWESDPLIYSLYADVLSGALSPARLADVLAALAVERLAMARIERAAEALSEAGHVDAVARIYINLERRTPPGRFHAFGARLVPAFNSFQTGASLYEIGLLDAEGIPDIAGALIDQSGYTVERLRNSLDDLVRRGHLRPDTRGRVVGILERSGVRAAGARKRLRERLRAALAEWRERRRRAAVDAPAPVAIDYEHILQDWSRRGLRGA